MIAVAPLPASNTPIPNQLTILISLPPLIMPKAIFTWIITIGPSIQIICTSPTLAQAIPLDQANTEFWASELEMEVQATLATHQSSPFT